MARLRTKILVGLLIVILSVVMGAYIGIKNTSTYQIESMDFTQISDNIEVYRNERGVPTIIAESDKDLFFAQGFEFARDRLWQAEFYRSVMNGELSRLFGDSQKGADKYLLSLGIAKAGQEALARADDDLVDLIKSYVDGLNEYIERHENNLPIEFTLLGVKPKKWELKDVFGMQGVMSQTLSLSSLGREFFRTEIAKAFGPKKAAEIYPIQYQTAEDYYLEFNFTQISSRSHSISDKNLLVEFPDKDIAEASNNWVVGPQKTESGAPILANDPHLSLATPGIWWEVHLISSGYHVEGFALPGVPGVVIGHNEHVAWGVTNTGLDAVDIFYFVTSDDGTQYYIDGEWKDFEIQAYTLQTEDSENFEVKWTDYGPVLDPDVFSVPDDGNSYVLRWTLLEDHPRDIIVKSVLGYNKAQNTQEFRAALEYFAVPGQNFVFATVDGDFGYQFTGLIPIRKTEGSGVLPQNGSDPSFGWSGFVDYEDQYFEVNPTKGYFSTANEEIDPRETTNFTDSVYITDLYALPYRGNRIKMVLEENNEITPEDMQNLQGDTHNLYAEIVLKEVLNEIKQAEYSEDIDKIAQRAIVELDNWNYRMARNETGATVFAIFRIFFEEQTFIDEFEQFDTGFYKAYDGRAERGMSRIIANTSSEWFDDVTTSITETRADITQRAFEKTSKYLSDNIGNRRNSWKYEKLHRVVFEHPIGTQLGFFNEGGIASDGSEYTVMAAGGTPSYDDGEVDMTQTSGSSMRFVVQVDEDWSIVRGITPPGESQHFLSGHRGDTAKDWTNNVLYDWDFSDERAGIPSFTFRKN